MQALRFENNKLRVAEIPGPSADSEARVRVLRSGICNTDLEIVKGYAGFEGTIGHEFVGIVEKSTDRLDLVGKRVVGEINAGCGVCSLCFSGDPRHCERRTVLGIHGRDGAHAEYLTLPSRNLIEVPKSVSDEEAVFAEPLAAAFGITEQVEIISEMSVAVVGDGKLGLLCALALNQRTGRLILIGKHRSKLQIATRQGVETVLLEDAVKLGRRFDVVVEASGSESGFETALDLVRPRGKIVLKSTFHGKPTWQATRVVVDEISIIGSRCGRFAPALELLTSKKVGVLDLISEEYGLTEGVKAMKRAEEKGVLKVLLKMNG
jgi:threonine dehydrogenase-like Zn-dependent dehydrogenase